MLRTAVPTLFSLTAVFQSACAGLEPVDSKSPTATVPGPEARIDSIAPNFGTNGGNELITITGGPFPTDAAVLVGGVEATVLAATPNQLQISSPASDKTDWVSIKIQGPDGSEIKQNKAYQLWEDGNGQTGLWGEIYRRDYLGSYWSAPGTQVGPYTPPPAAQVRMVFLNPSDLAYEELWAPYWDWCEVDYNPSLQATTLPTGMDALTLSGTGGESIRLEPSASDLNYFDALDIEPLLLRPDTEYSLDSGASNGDWPAFGVDNLATMPERPGILAPSMDDSVPGTTEAEVDLQWVPGAPGSYIAAIVTRTSESGAVIEERATCLLTDDGQFTIPAETWSDWIPGEYLMIQLGRIHHTQRTLPHNRSNSELVSVHWVYGATQAL